MTDQELAEDTREEVLTQTADPAPGPEPAAAGDNHAAPDETDAGVSPGDDSGDSRFAEAVGPRGEVRYDFTRPWSISNKFHQNLASIAEAFANQLSFAMSNYLRTTLDVTFNAVKQELFKDYLDRLPERKCIGVFSILPLGGQSVITVDGNIMFIIMDKLIGGEGRPQEISRDYTEIETRIFMLVMNKILADLREAARKFFDSEVHLSRLENTPAFVAVMTGGEKVITMSLEMTIGEHKGSIMVATPMAGFDPVMTALDPKDEAILEKADAPLEHREKILKTVNEASVEVTAVLGESNMTLQRLLDIDVGDTIILDRRINDPIAVNVGRKTVCYGQPGKSQNRKAVRID
jgi:flagellar motor switch protein FliM